MFRLFLWYLFKKTRCRERIERANAWAEQNKGRTATMTVGTLFMLLVIGSVMTLSGNDEPEMNIIDGIAEVNPMFQGLEQIQDYRKSGESHPMRECYARRSQHSLRGR